MFPYQPMVLFRSSLIVPMTGITSFRQEVTSDHRAIVFIIYSGSVTYWGGFNYFVRLFDITYHLGGILVHNRDPSKK